MHLGGILSLSTHSKRNAVDSITINGAMTDGWNDLRCHFPPIFAHIAKDEEDPPVFFL